jgi:putative acetyltransferase
MKILTISPDNEQVKNLIDQADTLMSSLYPPDSNHLDGVEELKKPNVLFVGAYKGQKLVGCGAVKTLNDHGSYGEIKRVFVLPEHRGQRISFDIMRHLENHLIESGIRTARLETGAKQPEALGLYRKIGYIERGPFGAYREDPLSIFMEKALYA